MRVITLHRGDDILHDMRNARDLHGGDGHDDAQGDEKDPHETCRTGWPWPRTL